MTKLTIDVKPITVEVPSKKPFAKHTNGTLNKGEKFIDIFAGIQNPVVIKNLFGSFNTTTPSPLVEVIIVFGGLANNTNIFNIPATALGNNLFTFTLSTHIVLESTHSITINFPTGATLAYLSLFGYSIE